MWLRQFFSFLLPVQHWLTRRLRRSPRPHHPKAKSKAEPEKNPLPTLPAEPEPAAKSKAKAKAKAPAQGADPTPEVPIKTEPDVFDSQRPMGAAECKQMHSKLKHLAATGNPTLLEEHQALATQEENKAFFLADEWRLATGAGKCKAKETRASGTNEFQDAERGWMTVEAILALNHI